MPRLAENSLRCVEVRPEDYQRLHEIFQQASILASEERGAFLDSECGDSFELRREVEDLLANDADDTALPQPLIPHEILGQINEKRLGQVIKQYRITANLGSGGMGTVYGAEDTNLGRKVALKFPAAHLIGDETFAKRFLREAKAAATLDHPNICTVYEIGQSDTGPFIAMAFLEGETLRTRIDRGSLSIQEALRYAVQIAEGLEAAHARGVVHRDIKPDNLMLFRSAIGTDKPRVKILDFGVARLGEQTALTGGDAVPGTVQYMSPEQIRGDDADERSDIWALGVVLYEMVCGRKPFRSHASLLPQTILSGEPEPLRTLRQDVPQELERVVEKALAKSPEKRYQRVADLLADLETVLARTSPQTAGYIPLASTARANRWWMVAGFALVAVAIVLATRPVPVEPPRTHDPRPLTHYPGNEDEAAISPDGKMVAFVWDGEEGAEAGDLYVQLIDSTEPLRLTNTASREHSPTWSPDSSQVAFLREVGLPAKHQLIVIDALGGPEIELLTTPSEKSAGLSWSPDAGLIAVSHAVEQGPKGIYLANVDDRSTRRVVTTPGSASFFFDFAPQFSPDGTHIAFIRRTAALSELRLVSTSGGESELLMTGLIDGYAWGSSGRSLVISSRRQTPGGSLLRFDLESQALEPLFIGGSTLLNPTIRGDLLAVTSWRLSSVIWQLSVSADGDKPSIRPEPEALISSTYTQHTQTFSPDGRMIAFVSDRSGSQEIWTSNRNGDSLRRLTSLELVGSPAWSPDGRWIAFDSSAQTPGNVEIYVINAQGGQPRRLTNQPSQDRVPSWSNDGQWIYFGSNRSGRRQVWKIPVEGGNAIQLTNDRGFQAVEAPDGKSLYYNRGSKRSGIWKLDLNTGEESPVSELADAGYHRYWALSKRAFYYLEGNAPAASGRTSLIKRFDFDSREVTEVARFDAELSGEGSGLSVSPDGRELLFTTVEVNEKDILVVDNFR